MKIFLQKDEQAIKKNTELGQDKYPIMRLSMITEDAEPRFIEIAAFWKSKSGKGLNGKWSDKYEFTFKKKEVDVPPPAPKTEYPAESITPDDIPF